MEMHNLSIFWDFLGNVIFPILISFVCIAAMVLISWGVLRTVKSDDDDEYR